MNGSSSSFGGSLSPSPGAAGTRLRVLVADDSLSVRRFLVELVEAQPDMVVVGEARDGLEAASMCQALRVVRAGEWGACVCGCVCGRWGAEVM